MVNLIKVIVHIKKVGWKKFMEEFSSSKEEVLQDPLTSLRLQTQGYTGAILFQIIAAGLFIYYNSWTISGIMFFYCLVTIGQLISTRNQIRQFQEMKKMEQEQIRKSNEMTKDLIIA